MNVMPDAKSPLTAAAVAAALPTGMSPLQLLDHDLEEAEEQHQAALRAHLIVIDSLLDLQVGTVAGGEGTSGPRAGRALQGPRGGEGPWLSVSGDGQGPPHDVLCDQHVVRCVQ
jgi:hypothetical protein